MAQHHESMARLLDCSENPLAALGLPYEFHRFMNMDSAAWVFVPDDEDRADESDRFRFRGPYL
jgi:hypothetical protein